MTDNNLEFLETLTVEQFKAAQHVDVLKVKQNPQNGKLFFTFGAAVGAVASKGIPTNPMVSRVKGEPTEQNPSGIFFLLHEEGNGAPVVATF